MKRRKLTIQTRSLESLAAGVYRYQIDCWRFTLRIRSLAGISVDNTDISLVTPNSIEQYELKMGGAVVNGEPVSIQHELAIRIGSAAAGLASGQMIFEHIEK